MIGFKKKMNNRGDASVIIILGIIILALGFISFRILNSRNSNLENAGNSLRGPLSRLDSFRSNDSTKPDKEICITNEEYEEVPESLKNILSLPFDPDNYYTKHWGMVPHCAELRNGQTHGALDFELKPNTKVFSASDGVVTRTEVGKAEGSGEIIAIQGNGFHLDYSGLNNVQVKAGESVKKGDYIANAVQIPHGEYHLHLGISISGNKDCLLKYMDTEFYDATLIMFAQADYRSQTDAKCLCNCETVTANY